MDSHSLCDYIGRKTRPPFVSHLLRGGGGEVRPPFVSHLLRGGKVRPPFVSHLLRGSGGHRLFPIYCGGGGFNKLFFKVVG